MTKPDLTKAAFFKKHPLLLSGGVRRTLWLLVPVIGIGVFFIFALQRAWLCDDVYISLRTVDNFLYGYGLTWNVAERVQTYTHPLWLFLLILGVAFTHETYFTTIFISLLVSCLAAWVLVFKVARTRLLGTCGVLVLALSSSFVDYSASGLENPLTHLLLALFAWVYFAWQTSPKKLFWLSLVASLAVVNRMDTILFYVPALVYGLWEYLRQGESGVSRAGKPHKAAGLNALGLLLLGQLPFFLWECFAIVYYGFPFANTAYAKLQTGIPALDLINQGWIYLNDAWQHDPLVIVGIMAGVILPLLKKDWRSLPLVLGIMLYLAYMVSIGGDFMRGRFLTAPFFCALILLLRLDLPRLDWRWSALVLVVIFIVELNTAIPSWQLTPAVEKYPIDLTGIADERMFYFKGNGLFSGLPWVDLPGFAWRYIGEYWKRSGIRVKDWDSVGMVGYFAGPQVHIVDRLAITEPLLARLPMKVMPKWRIGHYPREVPLGYLETLESGQNQIANRRLAEYYDKLALITRGPLWDPARWQAIWKMNTGQYDSLKN